MFKSINGGILPQRATKYSAGFDVFANEDVTIGAGETVSVGLGVALISDDKHWDRFFRKQGIGIDNGIHDDGDLLHIIKSTYYLELHPRSSIRAKGLGGGVGIIDIDYLDEIKMVIHNPYKKESDFGINAYIQIKKGDKIGQLILCRHEGWLLPLEYTKDEERNGGFGSTDKAKHES